MGTVFQWGKNFEMYSDRRFAKQVTLRVRDLCR